MPRLPPLSSSVQEADKSVVRSNIVECLVSSGSRKLAVLLSASFGHVAAADFPEQWPEVLPQARGNEGRRDRERERERLSARAVLRD